MVTNLQPASNLAEKVNILTLAHGNSDSLLYFKVFLLFMNKIFNYIVD